MNYLNNLQYSQLSAVTKAHAVRMWQKYNNKSKRTEAEIIQLFKDKKFTFNRAGEHNTITIK